MQIDDILLESFPIRYKGINYIHYHEYPKDVPRLSLEDRVYFISRDMFLNFDSIHRYERIESVISELTGGVSFYDRNAFFCYQELTKETWIKILEFFLKVERNDIKYLDLTKKLKHKAMFFETEFLNELYCSEDAWFRDLKEICVAITDKINVL